MRMAIKPDDRVHMLVWRVHPSAPDSPGWRTAEAINGIPITFGQRFGTWEEALRNATELVDTEGRKN